MKAYLAAWSILGFVALAAAGCTSLQRNYGPLPDGSSAPAGSPSSSGSASPAPTPSSCATQNPAATLIAMVSFITATPDPTYGTIAGYAFVSTDGTAPVVAEPLTVTAGTVVQFQNGEESATPLIYHSAAGIPGATSFPAVPYTFPSADIRPVGAQIGSAAWSTGLIAPGCFSQSFTAGAAGTYFFGDVGYYDLGNVRDVFVVSP